MNRNDYLFQQRDSPGTDEGDYPKLSLRDSWKIQSFNMAGYTKDTDFAFFSVAFCVSFVYLCDPAVFPNFVPQKTSMDKFLNDLIESTPIAAAIFDLDGTLVDNNEFHLKSWKQYIANLGISITEEEYNANINGRTNKDAAQYIFGRPLSDEEAMGFALEKEALYREMYAPFIKAVPGLLELLEELHQRGIVMAIATSGIQVNIDFLFEHVPIRKYFSVIVNSAHIKKGKPDPEIYLKAASLLNVPPANCLVFEDAVVGIKSARAAGMHVIALSTTHPEEELMIADRVVADFNALL